VLTRKKAWGAATAGRSRRSSPCGAHSRPPARPGGQVHTGRESSSSRSTHAQRHTQRERDRERERERWQQQQQCADTGTQTQTHTHTQTHTESQRGRDSSSSSSSSRITPHLVLADLADRKVARLWVGKVQARHRRRRQHRVRLGQLNAGLRRNARRGHVVSEHRHRHTCMQRQMNKNICTYTHLHTCAHRTEQGARRGACVLC
jgi:hypothetical protein